ncbi:hypothetical protein WAX88_16225 [Photobacterium damselae subsp. damselae]|uniref:hypothetical protein n=1 Tax=Photobacterium damselae TaxID=38293 RepID=UPI00311AD756
MNKHHQKGYTVLVDGASYRFELNGNICCGVFILKNNIGYFCCNGDIICCASDALCIERLYSYHEINNSLVVTDENGSTIDFSWSEGVIELSGVVNNEI